MGDKVRLTVYLVVIALLLVDEDLRVIAPVWYWLSRFWYGMAEFAGTQGIKSEHRYHEMVAI